MQITFQGAQASKLQDSQKPDAVKAKQPDKAPAPFTHQQLMDSFDQSSAARLAKLKVVQKQYGLVPHLMLAGWYGIIDSNIRKMNATVGRIRGLQKSSDTQQSEKANKDLKNLRGAIASILFKHGFDGQGNVKPA